MTLQRHFVASSITGVAIDVFTLGCYCKIFGNPNFVWNRRLPIVTLGINPIVALQYRSINNFNLA